MQRRKIMKATYLFILLLAGVLFALPAYAGAQAANEAEVARRFAVCMRKVATLEKEINTIKQTADDSKAQLAAAPGSEHSAVDPWWFDYSSSQR
jgi:hypothetical protein